MNLLAVVLASVPYRKSNMSVLRITVLLILLSIFPPVVSGQSLSPSVTDALDAVLACERPQGGWMYTCRENVRVAGFTSFMRRAERFADAVGLATWDLIVLRSPGTPAAGLLLLQAYQRTKKEEYLAAARRGGELLVNLQLPSGGWFSEMPASSDRLAFWFRLIVPWATLDDDVTPGATRFLLTLWEVTGEARFREAAERGIALLRASQLSSGAWPLTWRPGWLRFLSPSFEDWPSLNDAATTSCIHTLLAGARILNKPELRDAARRGGEWLLRVRGAPPNAGWAQQYDPEGKPAAGRRFEPIALASWESRHALEALQALAEKTDDTHFCAAFPETIAWLARSALAPGCWARFYSPDANTPVYIDQAGKVVPNEEHAKRPYRWTGDFGIPALFASLGLDASGRRAKSEVPLTPAIWQVSGATGDCPGDTSRPRDDLASLGPRARMSEAASRLASVEPRALGACASVLLPDAKRMRLD